jgi:hypothetical protein
MSSSTEKNSERTRAKASNRKHKRRTHLLRDHVLVLFVFALVPFVYLSLPAEKSPSDPVTDLRTKLSSGEVTLQFNAERGYLASLLENLKIRVSSQTLVFSKTSLQSERISPEAPRALYFNDEVYVAWVPGTSAIEIMSVDPQKGAVFYMLGQKKDDSPVFEKSTGHECSVCHYVPGFARFVPSLTVSSVLPDVTGNVEGAFPIPMTDQSPMQERWGGWYVTGTHGDQKHLGNIVLKTPRSVLGDTSSLDFARSSNLTDLKSRFDTARYLSPHSDIVALMVLTHQVEVQNLITLAIAKAGDTPESVGESLVKAMVFEGAEPLRAPVQGTSNFAAEFASEGPRDSHGRSLRDFDLKTRLFRYPLSYLIYSKSFDALPKEVKAYVYRRLREILAGTDRAEILEILRETKADFAS